MSDQPRPPSSSSVPPSTDAPFVLPRWCAIPIALVGVILNEWLLGALFAVDGEVVGLKLWIIRCFNIVMLTTAAVTAMGWFKPFRFYRDVALISFNIIVLFVVLNILTFTQTSHWALEYYYGALEYQRLYPEAAIEAVGVETIEEVSGRVYTPGATAHPSLPMVMRAANGPYYNSGPHGERVSCRGGTPVTAPLDGAVWMLGGSTTYGSGVADCETITSYLLDEFPDQAIVNLGVETFGRNAQMDRLFLLLRQGYRPKAVIFFDGLNDIDINVLRAAEFPAMAAPPVVSMAYYHAVMNRNDVFMANLLGRLPLMQWLGSTAPTSLDDINFCAVDPLDAGLEQPDSLYDTDPLTHMARQHRSTEAIRNSLGSELPDGLIDQCAERLIRMYAKDQEVLQRMGGAFGFQSLVFFQMLGSLSTVNPFIRDPESFAVGGYRAFVEGVSEAVRAEIAGGRLRDMVDLSQLGIDCAECFVDPHHYTPGLNQQVAAAMAESLRARSVLSAGSADE